MDDVSNITSDATNTDTDKLNNTSESTKISKTILVSRLPATAQKREIEETFSTVGPLKKCFMVRNKGKLSNFKNFQF